MSIYLFIIVPESTCPALFCINKQLTLHYPLQKWPCMTINSTFHIYTFKIVNIIVTKYIIICFNDSMYEL